jgi:hypothetical protein
VDGDESDDDELPLLKAPPTSAVEAPTTSEGAYAKLGRLNGHENNRILSQYEWQGGVRAVDDNNHVVENECADPHTNFGGHRHAKSPTSESASVRKCLSCPNAFSRKLPPEI